MLMLHNALIKKHLSRKKTSIIERTKQTIFQQYGLYLELSLSNLKQYKQECRWPTYRKHFTQS